MREEMNKITDMFSFIFMIFNQVISIIIFVTLPLIINTKLTLTFIFILIICISPFLILRNFQRNIWKESYK